MASKDGSKLNMIVAQRRLDVTAARALVSEDDLRARIAGRAPPLDFAATVRGAAPMGLLAEIKRASPSKGDIAMGVDAASQALTYALAGACAISVLTEPNWFKGSLTDLENVRSALESAGKSPGTCVLRKDFIVEEYQLLEARAHGADTALLIVASLEEARLLELMRFARTLGMEPLVEVANEGEMATALKVGAKVIGVNNRNLHTFEVDMGTTGRLAAMITPEHDVLLIALSGVGNRDDVVSFANVGAKAVLVGESLMRAPSPATLIRELLALPAPPTLCKICGLRDPEAALCATDAGADFLGVIFAPSKRQVDEAEAKAIVDAVRERRPRPANYRPLTVAGSGVDAAAAAASGKGAEPARRWLQLWQALLANESARHGPLVVGVFVDETAEVMNAIAERVGLDIIQLHGKSEGWEVATQLVRPAIRVMHMADDVDAPMVSAQVRGGTAAAILLDSMGGGTGKTFDWQTAQQVRSQAPFPPTPPQVQSQAPFILAGGLHPENVAAAAQQARPWCVDVSSGVESGGVKDHAKIKAFVNGAHTALA